MEKWQTTKVFYYAVGDKKFDNEADAKEYALKVFLCEAIDRIWHRTESGITQSINLNDDGTFTIGEHKAPIVEIDEMNGRKKCITETSIKIITQFKRFVNGISQLLKT